MEFAEGYRGYFDVARRNVGDKARCYLAGLLMKAPRKTLWKTIVIRETTKGTLKISACRKRVWLWDGQEETARCPFCAI